MKSFALKSSIFVLVVVWSATNAARVIVPVKQDASRLLESHLHRHNLYHFRPLPGNPNQVKLMFGHPPRPIPGVQSNQSMTEEQCKTLDDKIQKQEKILGIQDVELTKLSTIQQSQQRDITKELDRLKQQLQTVVDKQVMFDTKAIGVETSQSSDVQSTLSKTIEQCKTVDDKIQNQEKILNIQSAQLVKLSTTQDVQQQDVTKELDKLKQQLQTVVDKQMTFDLSVVDVKATKVADRGTNERVVAQQRELEEKITEVNLKMEKLEASNAVGKCCEKAKTEEARLVHTLKTMQNEYQTIKEETKETLNSFKGLIDTKYRTVEGLLRTSESRTDDNLSKNRKSLEALEVKLNAQAERADADGQGRTSAEEKFTEQLNTLEAHMKILKAALKFQQELQLDKNKLCADQISGLKEEIEKSNFGFKNYFETEIKTIKSDFDGKLKTVERLEHQLEILASEAHEIAKGNSQRDQEIKDLKSVVQQFQPIIDNAVWQPPLS